MVLKSLQTIKVTSSLFLLLILIQSSNGHLRRCFSCRSRGDQGDCRDPFYLAATNTSSKPAAEVRTTGVETPPCASGWCSKTIEGVDKTFKDAEYGRATQRDCLRRPPSDGKERCAYVTVKAKNNKKVFMCFCQGDLCNGAHNSNKPSYLITILSSSLLCVVFILNRLF
ncbi:unnamed protein product [Lepeophtheirus salmonis]|uniref:(salmon louse) hypothetical protein n=1 Tax=Lepeophtheirus salmonis TaxID=72036 RepID=A0A0K2T0G0_LEPSM|nr:uncharacterized protein LOC121123150 [Lepeophtheirus salmonis]CAB4068976.1 unnamed protein product [Lepeophtheirus salmonis]CAF3019266.1 unnamed protein product [Lepeophtheirus salmonis]